MFWDAFPFYLAIGMTYDQYWNQDCTLVKYYRKANEIRKDQINNQMWMQGAYIYEAIMDLVPALNPMTKPGIKPQPYLSKPLPRTTKDAIEQKKAEEAEQYEAIKNKMRHQMESVNRKFQT